ncbi:MAG: Tim44/TimA family putative adaptor protein [Hyphomicrobium sp.]
MNGTIDSFTLISLIVLLVLVFKLRSVLGRNTSDDEARIKARNEERERAAAAAQASEKVITLPRRPREENPAEAAVPDASVAEAEARIKTLAGNDNAVQRGLLDILKADPDFNPETFLTGARRAYEMIVTAFAEGNRKTLRDLLARDVFEEFSDAITDREKRGEQIDQSFVGINKADILEAELDKGMAQITVRFVSQLIKATRDKAGAVIDGDPGKVKDLTDIFTFSRDVSSAKALQNLNWRLIGTASPN